MNGYALLADLIALIHLVYVSFVLLGLVVIFIGGIFRWRFVRNFWFRAVHLAMILIVVVEALIGMTCPLTDWEDSFRIAAGQTGVTEGSFVARLVHQLMFFDFSPMFFAVAYCLFGAAVLASWWFLPPKRPFAKKVKNVSSECP